MAIQDSSFLSKYNYESHEPYIREFFGRILANGTEDKYGQSNYNNYVNVTKTGVGAYTISTVDTTLITTADVTTLNDNTYGSITDTANSYTCVCKVSAISTAGVLATNVSYVAVSSKPKVSSNGTVSFDVLTTQIPAAGGVPVSADNDFFYEISISGSSTKGR